MAHKIIIMGVAGCGKTTIGKRLAGVLSCQYIDGDDLHPADNIAKMSNGIALGDEDRMPWLDLVGKALADSQGSVIIGCSALKRNYRDRIRNASGSNVVFVHLHGSREVICERMQERQGHFMPVSLIDSQFADLEIPGADENPIFVDISLPVNVMITKIENALKGEFDAH